MSIASTAQPHISLFIRAICCTKYLELYVLFWSCSYDPVIRSLYNNVAAVSPSLTLFSACCLEFCCCCCRFLGLAIAACDATSPLTCYFYKNNMRLLFQVPIYIYILPKHKDIIIFLWYNIVNVQTCMWALPHKLHLIYWDIIFLSSNYFN